MRKQKLDKLLKEKILTKEEYDKFFETMSVGEYGGMTGFVPNGRFVYKYYFDGDMLSMTPLDFLLNYVTVPLGAEYMDKTFWKYSITICGICDGSCWFTEDNITQHARDEGHAPITEATESELWKMIAISERYWECFYKELHDYD